MHDDGLMETIAAALREPAADYVLWAEIGDGEITLETVRLPLEPTAEGSLHLVRLKARRSLASAGVVGAQADAVRLRLARLPSREDLAAVLDPKVAAGEELVLLDYTHWEAARRRLNLEPKSAGPRGDLELDYRGRRIRRSASS